MSRPRMTGSEGQVIKTEESRGGSPPKASRTTPLKIQPHNFSPFVRDNLVNCEQSALCCPGDDLTLPLVVQKQSEL